jgi:hypothetical protein
MRYSAKFPDVVRHEDNAERDGVRGDEGIHGAYRQVSRLVHEEATAPHAGFQGDRTH